MTNIHIELKNGSRYSRDNVVTFGDEPDMPGFILLVDGDGDRLILAKEFIISIEIIRPEYEDADDYFVYSDFVEDGSDD